MAAPTIVFDYDMTLSPGESLIEVVNIALDDHRSSPEWRARFERVRKRWAHDRMRLADLVAVFQLMRAVHRRHIEAYVNTRRQLPNDFVDMFQALRERGARLHIVSAAYTDWLAPLGVAWGFRPGEVHARYRFEWFCGAAHPLNKYHLARRPSKSQVIRRLQETGEAGRPLIVVGDSMEDLEAARQVQAHCFVAADYFTPRPVKIGGELDSSLSGLEIRRARHAQELPGLLLSMLA